MSERRHLSKYVQAQDTPYGTLGLGFITVLSSLEETWVPLMVSLGKWSGEAWVRRAYD